jgi:hypothetical protein
VKYAEAVNPLRWRTKEIKSDIRQMWKLPQQLVETCPYPELVEHRPPAGTAAWDSLTTR